MKLKTLSSIILVLAFGISACSSVPNYQLKQYGESEQYCHKTYRYCVNIPVLGDETQMTYLDDGFALMHSSGYKMVIGGAKFDDKKAENPISYQQFVDGILPLSETDQEYGWRKLNVDDGLRLQQGIIYVNKNHNYVMSGHYHYHIWLYNNKRYIDILVSYPELLEEDVNLVVEQMVNSIVLK